MLVAAERERESKRSDDDAAGDGDEDDGSLLTLLKHQQPRVSAKHDDEDDERDADLAQINGGHACKRTEQRQGPLPQRGRARRVDQAEQRGVHPGPATAPGLSNSPGGRTISPLGPWYVTAPKP